MATLRESNLLVSIVQFYKQYVYEKKICYTPEKSNIRLAIKFV